MPACTPVSREPIASVNAPGCLSPDSRLDQRGDHLAQPGDVDRGPVPAVDDPDRRVGDLRPQPGVVGDVPGGLVGQPAQVGDDLGGLLVAMTRGPDLPSAPAVAAARSQSTNCAMHPPYPCGGTPGCRDPLAGASGRAPSAAAAGGERGGDPVQRRLRPRPRRPAPASASTANASSRPSAVVTTPGDRADPGQRAGLGPDHARRRPPGRRRRGNRSVERARYQAATGRPAKTRAQLRAVAGRRPARAARSAAPG